MTGAREWAICVLTYAWVAGTGTAERGRRAPGKVLADYLGTGPALVRVTVTEGVVTLAGEVEKKSMISFAVRMSRSVDGVVDVAGDLERPVAVVAQATTKLNQRALQGRGGWPACAFIGCAEMAIGMVRRARVASPTPATTVTEPVLPAKPAPATASVAISALDAAKVAYEASVHGGSQRERADRVAQWPVTLPGGTLEKEHRYGDRTRRHTAAQQSAGPCLRHAREAGSVRQRSVAGQAPHPSLRRPRRSEKT